jgi:two-component system sensor histidine kinase/response regulator
MSSNPGSEPDTDRTGPVARAERAERLLDLNERLVAGLIHDLRTPLMAINLSAEVAIARSSDESVQQAARRIRTSSERMSRIFDHLLNLSRVTNAVPSLELRPADLGHPLDAAIDEARAARPDAVFDITREGDLAGVFDATLICRTIANVVGTSLPQIGEARTINIHVDGTHRDRLWLRVSVPGVIPPDVQEGLFVPGRNARGLEVPGLGLGLHEVDPFVRAHGGSIVGRSRAPTGTVFEILLPRDATAQG